MKFLYVLFLCTIACGKDLKKSGNTAYYFCYSHSSRPLEDAEIQNILYTDVREIHKEDQIIQNKTYEWSTLVKGQCKNKNGCTSDLMYYETAQQAHSSLQELLAMYDDPKRFKMDKVALQ